MKWIALCFLCLPLCGFAQRYELIPLTSGENTSLRGMSVTSDEVAWVSGTNGSVGKTIDGGKSWQWMKPAGYEKLDFRDIQAFDAKRAIIVNAGSPAFILVTHDGGITWKETYKNLDSAIFLDGMDFWDEQNGMVFGDPIQNKMQLLRTEDGGAIWQDVSANLTSDMAVGEAGFAASGSTLKTLGKGKVWIATGGTVSNIYYSPNHGNSWEVFSCPIWAGESSTGAFSMDFYDGRNGVVVGGNYLKDKETKNNVLLTSDAGRTWKKPVQPVSGYRSGVIYLNAKTLVATGSSGTDVSTDGGENWFNISDANFNVIQRSGSAKLVLLAGNKGQIHKLVILKK